MNVSCSAGDRRRITGRRSDGQREGVGGIGRMPLAAVMVSVVDAGCPRCRPPGPASVAVPSPLSTNVTPEGRHPVSEIALAAGNPWW